MKGLIIGVVILVVLGTIVATQYVGYHNDWTNMKNKYEAQVEADKVIYDNVWKVIKQQAQVSDQYADKFKESYVAIMEGRYGDEGRQGGGFFNVLQEQNPQFDATMYKQLMNTIDSKRTEFTANQKLLVAYHQELKNMKEKIPSSWFLGSKELPELQTVTSGKTKETFETGEENDVDVF